MHGRRANRLRKPQKILFLVARSLREKGGGGKDGALRNKLFFKLEKNIPEKMWPLSSRGALGSGPLKNITLLRLSLSGYRTNKDNLSIRAEFMPNYSLSDKEINKKHINNYSI